MKENFLIITFLNDYLEVAAIKADFDKKKLEVINISHFNKDQFFYPLKRILFYSFFPKFYNVIFVFDSKLAATYYDVISLACDNLQRPINEADLDNLVSQALWKFFDQGRIDASRQLCLNDTEILLSDIQIYDFKINNRRIINPLGHSAKKIEIYLVQTFTQRSLFKKLLSLLPRRAKLILVTEGGTMAAHLFSRIAKKDKFFFAKVTDNQTDLFMAKNNKITFFDYFNWGKNNLCSGISNVLKISPVVSQSIIDRFVFCQTSLNFKKRFNKIFLDEIINLFKGLKIAASRTKISAVFVDFSQLTSPFAEGLKFKRISTKMIISLDLNKMIEVFGFEFIDCTTKNISLDLLSLAALIEFYFSPISSFPLSLINHLAKQRTKWLIP